MGRSWTEEEYERTIRKIEYWIMEARRMYAGAHKSIGRVMRVKEKLIEQQKKLNSPRRVSPWAEE